MNEMGAKTTYTVALKKKNRRFLFFKKKEKQLNRSMAGNTIMFVIMAICGVFMALPLVMILNNAFKPLDELFRFPPQIFVRNPSVDNFGDLYVLMSTSWVRVIEEFERDGKKETFAAPNGVYVSARGNLYIADTNNKRVVELDGAGKLVQVIENPKSDVLEEGYEFRPMKVAVDYADRVYVIAQNQFEGIMAFNESGDFLGFTGTINVQITPWEIFWRRFSTKEQRARQQLFIPTEFTGMEIDGDGFVYATNVDGEGKQSVRRLNPGGEDVIQKKESGLSGDLDWRLAGTYSGPSRIVDVVVRSQGIYSILDSVRGRIFTYDHEGNLLYIFGGLGSQEGTFTGPVAIDTIDGEILVLDATRNLVNRFRATRYGSLINQAVGLRYDGDEVQAVECWKEVLELDSNFELAYVGIGKSYLAAGQNKEAMECFHTGNSKQYYSIAYKRYRNELLKENMGTILTSLIVLVVLWMLWSRLGKKRRVSHV